MAKDRYPRTFHTENPQALQTELGQLVDALRARDRQGPLNAPSNEWDLLQPVNGAWDVEPSLATRPSVGDVWRWNGTLWAPGVGSGTSAIRPLAAGANTVGLWVTNNTLANIVDPSNPLTVTAGNEIYADIVPGKPAFFFDGSTRLSVAAFVAALALTGNMSVFSIWQFDSDITATTSFLLGHGAAGELSAANVLYSQRAVAALGVPPRSLQWFSEHGAGVNDVFDTVTATPTVSLPPVHQLYLFAASRVGNQVQQYVNGRQFGGLSPVLTAPDGGGSGRFNVGHADAATSVPRALFWCARVDNVGLSAADHLAVYNATLGQGFGVLT